MYNQIYRYKELCGSMPLRQGVAERGWIYVQKIRRSCQKGAYRERIHTSRPRGKGRRPHSLRRQQDRARRKGTGAGSAQTDGESLGRYAEVTSGCGGGQRENYRGKDNFFQDRNCGKEDFVIEKDICCQGHNRHPQADCHREETGTALSQGRY